MKLDKNLIMSSLQQTIDEFGKDELAFLALTTKIELPLRDRWAYVLHKKLAKQSFIVSREWKRVDLAVLEESTPVALVELKAMYTFDAVSEKGNYKKRIGYLKQDIQNVKKFASRNTNIYGVLLATHPKKIISNNLTGIVKYRTGINGAFKRLGNHNEIARVASERVEKFLEKSEILKSGVLKGGSAFGIEADVLYWIVE